MGDPLKLAYDGPLVTLDIVAGDYRARNVRGLIDTGATRTMLSLELAKALHITTDKTAKAGGSFAGVQKIPCTIVRGYSLYFPGGGTAGNTTISIDDHTHGATMFSKDYGFDLLIGRDVLRCAKFTYDGARGITDLTFMSPTIEETEVVRDDEGRISRTVKKRSPLFE